MHTQYCRPPVKNSVAHRHSFSETVPFYLRTANRIGGGGMADGKEPKHDGSALLNGDAEALLVYCRTGETRTDVITE